MIKGYIMIALWVISMGLIVAGIVNFFQGEIGTGIFCLLGSFAIGTIGGLIFTPKR